MDFLISLLFHLQSRTIGKQNLIKIDLYPPWKAFGMLKREHFLQPHEGIDRNGKLVLRSEIKCPVFEPIQHYRGIIWHATLWKNHNAVSLCHTLGTFFIDIGTALCGISIYQDANSSINCPENWDFFQFFLSYKTKWMMRLQDAYQHNIHYGRMVGNEDILLVFVNFTLRFRYKTVPKAHSVEHTETPQPNEEIRIPKVIFLNGK